MVAVWLMCSKPTSPRFSLFAALRSPSKPALLPWVYVHVLYQLSVIAANNDVYEANSLGLCCL